MKAVMVHLNHVNQMRLADETTSSYLSLAISQFQKVSLIQFALLALTAWYVARNLLPLFDPVKAPSVGYRSVFEPSLLVRIRFALGALSQIDQGYQKYKNGLFRLCRNDRNVVVIPTKYVDELQNLPGEVLSSSKAVYAVRHHSYSTFIDINHVGDYAGLSIMLEGNLHSTTLQSRLTPSIPKLVSTMESEILKALPSVVPECEDRWVEVGIYDILLNLVSRVTNRVLLGEPDCYNDDWAKASMNYAANVTLTIGILRLFPSLMRPLVALMLPAVWNVQKNLQLAKQALIPIINQRREAMQNNADYRKPDDFLQWMMDAAVDDEARPDKLAHRLLIVFLGAAHTSTMAGAHVCYDLCAMPDYLEPLRDEIFGLLDEDGGWNPTTPNMMRKMDSFLRESQRINPPSLLDFHRLVQKPLKLSDGQHLPAGTQLCTASYAISQDPDNVSHAQDFDGFRYYNQRKEIDDDKKHQFATTDKTHMHFGRGKYACPGRFFASAELKIIIAHLIMQYDFKYPDGKGRPVNLNADEFLYPDPSARLLLKRRRRS